MENFQDILSLKESYQVNIKNLYYVGLFRLENPTIFWRIRSNFVFWFCVILPNVTAIYSVFNVEGVNEKTEKATLSFAMLPIVPIVINFKLNQNKIVKVLKLFDSLDKNDEQSLLNISSNKITKLLTAAFFSFTIGYNTFYWYHSSLMFSPALGSGSRFFLNLGTAIEFTQTMTIIVIVINIPFTFFALIILLERHFHCLGIKLERFVKFSQNSEAVDLNEELIKLTKYHQTLKRSIFR